MVTLEELARQELLRVKEASQDYAVKRRREAQTVAKQVEQKYNRELHQTALEQYQAVQRTQRSY